MEIKCAQMACARERKPWQCALTTGNVMWGCTAMVIACRKYRLTLMDAMMITLVLIMLDAM